MGSVRKISIAFLLIIWSISCKEPFTADALFEATNFLVVEGYINLGSGPTIITLSRTAKLESKEPIKMELNAIVRVEDEDFTTHPVLQSGDGVYSSELNLPSDRSYRLHITTTDGKEFVSAFIAPVHTPEIDSVFWTYGEQGVNVELATHDPLNQTRYYQWDYAETWEISSEYLTHLRFEQGKFFNLTAEETFAQRTCWKTATQRDLTLHSTASLTEDIVPGYQLVFIPKGAERLGVRYSILVRQHALTKAAFDYLQLMKKNTGPLGSFSDPQPSELNGNIICLDSNEPVVGYIGAYTTSERRIFIDNSEVPDWNFTLFCEQKHNINHPDTLIKYFVQGFYRPIRATLNDSITGEVIEYDFSYAFCVDCRTRNGVNIKPDFWD